MHARFEELATRAHDMEISIANHRRKNPSMLKQQRDKDMKKDGKSTEESMVVILDTTKKPKMDIRHDTQKNDRSQEKEKHLALKELQEKKYPFLDSYVPGTLDNLIEKKVI